MATQRGFTLIEVMIVVGLIGILAFMAAPSFTGMIRRSQLSGEGRTLYGAFVEAQGLAKRSGKVHCLKLSRTASTWEILLDDDRDYICETSVKLHNLNTAIGYGPADGYPTAFPAPYNGVAHDSWCTACAASDGEIAFQTDGTVVDISTGTPTEITSGSIAVHDTTGTLSSVFGLVFIGPTGDVRLFGGN